MSSTGKSMSSEDPCQPCDEGLHATDVANEKCTCDNDYNSEDGFSPFYPLCAPDSYSDSDVESYTACEEGTWNAGYGNVGESSCRQCSYGYKYEYYGITECDKCLPNHFKNISSTDSLSKCQVCPAGYHSTYDSDYCFSCVNSAPCDAP